MTDIDEAAGTDVPEGQARCGIAALVGRANVGKSALLNALLGQKVSIVSPRPQTTRTRIHGVLTRPGLQIIFADLPGIHSKQPKAINRYMNRMALASLADSDVNLFVIEALRWTEEDERALEELRAAKRPILLLINNVDRAQLLEDTLVLVGPAQRLDQEQVDVRIRERRQCHAVHVAVDRLRLLRVDARQVGEDDLHDAPDQNGVGK